MRQRLLRRPEADRSFVLNENPVGAERSGYMNRSGKADRTYGAIDYLPSLDELVMCLSFKG